MLYKSFKHGFKLYTKLCIASCFASLGNATTMLLNAMIYSYTEPHCHSLFSLSLAMFLLASGAY